MRAVFNQIMKVAPSDSTVMIVGETGTGKELVAHSIHRHSRRQGSHFVALNCAAIPESLLENELFGHEKGAFTGAHSRKPGKFEAAHQGTLFLDEIGDMPLNIQAKVLRALEEHKIERLGGVEPVEVDVRFIVATNKDLPALVENGAFRQDLFYRLNVLVIHLPPLRMRREDIPLIAEHLLRETESAKRFSPSAIHCLIAYDWPGNVRELQNVVRSSALMADEVIEPAHLPEAVTMGYQQTPAQSGESAIADRLQSMDQHLQEMEKRMIIQALNQSQGVQKKAALLLGIKERSLWHRLKKYNIDASLYKRP